MKSAPWFPDYHSKWRVMLPFYVLPAVVILLLLAVFL